MLGHYLARDRPDTILIRNCANLKVSDAQFFGTEPLPAIHRRFRFVSNHHHGDWWASDADQTPNVVFKRQLWPSTPSQFPRRRTEDSTL